MNTKDLVVEVDREIERLTEVRNLLTGGSASSGRNNSSGGEVGNGRHKRHGGISAAGRARIAAAQKARWAKLKKQKAA